MFENIRKTISSDKMIDISINVRDDSEREREREREGYTYFLWWVEGSFLEFPLSLVWSCRMFRLL